MDVLYFAFANDPDRPLDELKWEDAALNRLLEPLAARGHFKIVRDSFATLDLVADKLSLYKKDLVLFHFSGHAGPNSLQLDGDTVQAKGIAALLAACPRLHLAVLNGCATHGQVALLQAQNVPAVIATYRPVDDPKAAAFAIQLYRSLSQLDELGGAFDAARGKVLAMDAGVDIARGLARRDQPANAPCWGLHWLPGREDATHWRLPTGAKAVPDDYVPNQLLLETLLKALAPYRLDIARIVEDEDNGLERSILDKREAVLKALPHPISEPVRFLLTPGTGGSDMTFFDQPGPDRLRQMAVVFDTVVELMAFVALAQLWDALLDPVQPPPALSDPARAAVRGLLAASADTRRDFDAIGLLLAIRQSFQGRETAYFVEELRQLHEAYREGEPFYEACRFFVDLKPRLGAPRPEAAILCVQAEARLSTVLAALGFMARYTIASVKNIDVMKNRSMPDTRYRHSIVKLVQRFVGLEEALQTMDEPMDSSSVLLMREDEDGERSFLNLTPFVIDENAFDEKAKVAKLHYFERYLPEPDAYAYRHIYMPGDLPLLVAQQKNFRVLKAQFEAFAQLLFHQPMREL